MGWWRGSMVVAAGAVVLAAGAWWGLAADGDDDAGRARPAPVVLDTGETLDLVPGCRRDICSVADRRDGFRHDGRRVAMLVVEGPGRCGAFPASRIHLVAASGPVWSGPERAHCGDPERGIDTDATGNAFLAFPAEESGTMLVVLSVRGDAVDDFGSFEGRFRGERAVASDTDGDGVYEIRVVTAGDERLFRWTGSQYREPS